MSSLESSGHLREPGVATLGDSMLNLHTYCEILGPKFYARGLYSR